MIAIKTGLGLFEWGELFSLLAVIVSFVTISINIFGRSKNETRNEQKMFDKLDRLSDVSRETNETVKAMNAKIDDHAERLARIESDRDTIFRRLKRIENTQDHCQACRIAKHQTSQEGLYND